MNAIVDFAEIKQKVSIERLPPVLGLQLQQYGLSWRGPCPACKQGGDRALAVTPHKKAFYCFAWKRGGDAIALAAHVKGMSQRDAAIFIAEQFHLDEAGKATTANAGTSSRNSSPEPQARMAAVAPKPALQPLSYLDPVHPSLQALGVSPDTAIAFESGYAGRGVLRGRFAVPIRTPDGTLLAYVGIAVSPEQSPKFLFHNFDPRMVIFNAERLIQGGDLLVCHDPLALLLAVESGIPAECLVSFLTETIAPEQLEQLIVLMDFKKIESCELH
ncbi:MAG: CHC2 zinc finger domain-containing protein [Alphaproteobacteria bacterium]